MNIAGNYLLPRTAWRFRIVCSSSWENFPLLMSGLK